jgi:hypothetical protein
MSIPASLRAAAQMLKPTRSKISARGGAGLCRIYIDVWSWPKADGLLSSARRQFADIER